MKKLIILLISLSLGLLFSCEKEDTGKHQSDTIFEPLLESFYAFNKDIEIVSTNGQHATIRVYSDNELGLTDYNSDNFRLIEVREGETLQEALVNDKVMDLSEGENKEEEEEEFQIEEDFKSEYAFKLINYPNNTKSHYAVSFFHNEDIEDDNSRIEGGWRYYSHYSTSLQNNEQTAEVSRHSFWRRVYYGMRYKYSSTTGWSTIQNEWKKIRNNQTVSETKNPCYQFRVRVKTKRNSAYTVRFDY